MALKRSEVFAWLKQNISPDELKNYYDHFDKITLKELEVCLFLVLKSCFRKDDFCGVAAFSSISNYLESIKFEESINIRRQKYFDILKVLKELGQIKVWLASCAIKRRATIWQPGMSCWLWQSWEEEMFEYYRIRWPLHDRQVRLGDNKNKLVNNKKFGN